MKPALRRGRRARRWRLRRGQARAQPFRWCCSTRNMPDMDGFAAGRRRSGTTRDLARHDHRDADVVGPAGRRAPAVRELGHRGLPGQAGQAGASCSRRSCEVLRRTGRRRAAPSRRRPMRLRRAGTGARACSAGRGQRRQPALAVRLLEKRGHDGRRRGQRARRRWRRSERAALRPRPDGRADARDGRPRGHRRHPRARTGERRRQAHPDHRDDGPRDEGRPRAVPRGRDGRVPLEAAPGRGPLRGHRTPRSPGSSSR